VPGHDPVLAYYLQLLYIQQVEQLIKDKGGDYRIVDKKMCDACIRGVTTGTFFNEKTLMLM
jgi:hypothetical protein